MSDEIQAAQQAIEKILAGLGVQTVICVDDIYCLDDASVGIETAIGWFSAAVSRGMEADCDAIVEQPSFFDTGEGEIWKRRLPNLWERMDVPTRASVLGKVAAAIGVEAQTERDLKNTSLLKQLIPPGRLLELSPDQWRMSKDEILKNSTGGNGILCLFDQNLQCAPGYTDRGGISLLANMIESVKGGSAICGLLTHTVNESQEIASSSLFAQEHGLRREDFFVLSKQRLDGSMRFAHGLKVLSINHARDKLTTTVRDFVDEANKEAHKALMQIDVYDFEHMVLRTSENEGVWEAETLFRLFEILRRASFRKLVFSEVNRGHLEQHISRIRNIRDVPTGLDDKNPLNQCWQIRRQELYEDADLLNPAHVALDLGDIFQDAARTYILLCQPCDLMIRKDGKRSAQTVTLAKIGDQTPAAQNVSSFPLHYFGPAGQTAYVKFRDAYHVAPDVLDLAVFNHDGQCILEPSSGPPSELHAPWRRRFEIIKGHLQSRHNTVQQIVHTLKGNEMSHIDEDTTGTLLALCIARSNLDVSLDYNGGVFRFGLRRVGRVRQPGATRLLSHYMSFLARDAEEHDFAAPPNEQNPATQAG